MVKVTDAVRLPKLDTKVFAASRDVTTSQQASDLGVSTDRCSDLEMIKRHLTVQDDASLHRLARIHQKRTEIRTYFVVCFQRLSNWTAVFNSGKCQWGTLWQRPGSHNPCQPVTSNPTPQKVPWVLCWSPVGFPVYHVRCLEVDVRLGPRRRSQ